MSLEYAEKRIREALKKAKGNPTKARQQIIAWINDDPKLLQALARPHLTGIVAHAVNRVIYREGLEAEQEDIPLSPKKLDMPPATFGQEILKALQSNNTPQFGREAAVPPVRRKQASQEHIDALRRLARKNESDD